MITATSSAQCGSSMMPARCCSPLEALTMICKRYRSTELTDQSDQHQQSRAAIEIDVNERPFGSSAEVICIGGLAL